MYDNSTPFGGQVSSIKALIAAINNFPQEWALTPCVGKQNFWPNWNKTKLDRAQLIEAIRSQTNHEGKPCKWTGVSVVTGPLSNGIMAIDFDGPLALQKYLELSGQLPPTKKQWTSGKLGHFQILLQVPPEKWEGLKPQKIELNGGQKLELRWNQCSTLPPSIHPDTGKPYFWKNTEEIAECPDFILDLMREAPTVELPQKPKPENPTYIGAGEKSLVDLLESEILPRLDAEEFYGSYLKLKSAGKNLKALCPFHDEKTGSFTISPDTKLFKCFGCSAGGGPVQFVYQLRGGSGSPTGKDFYSVVMELADRVGVQMPDPQPKSQNLKSQVPSPQGFEGSNKILTHPNFKTSNLGISLREAADLAHQILLTENDEISANIKLEEVRRQAGMSDYSWEHKIVKPLRRNMDAQRFKMELLGLLQMEDAVERERQIALMAPKYSMGAATLKTAMATMRVQTQTAESQGSISLNELFAETTEAIEWLVPGMLPVGETVLLTALPKTGKSKLAIDLAFCVATGEERFLGEDIKQGRVLLVCPDASKQSLKNELTRRGFRSQDSKYLRVLPRWNIDQISVLEKELEDFRPDFVVIDSLKAITSGKEVSENSAEFADNIITLNSLLTRYRAASLLVHHANKGTSASGVERARGSTAIVGACWGMWLMEPIPQVDPDNPKRMIVDPRDPNRKFHVTSRDSEGTILHIRFNSENNSWISNGEVELEEGEAEKQRTINDRVMEVFSKNPDKELSGPEIMELLGGIEKSQRGPIYNALNRMENKRLINVRPASGDKRYNLYSLPKPNQNNSNVRISPKLKFSVPPPPPTPTVLVDDYYSETLIEQELENSHQNSHQIVITPEPCASLKMAETCAEHELDPIVITSQLSQGGEGVICAEILEAAFVEGLTTIKKVAAQYSLEIVQEAIAQIEAKDPEVAEELRDALGLDTATLADEMRGALAGADRDESLAGVLADQMRKAIAKASYEDAAEVIKRVVDSAPGVKQFFAKSFTKEENFNIRLLKNCGVTKGVQVECVGGHIEQYAGEVLTVDSMNSRNELACLRPDGKGYTTWLKPEDLRKL